MDALAFQKFLDDLRAHAAADPCVLGLVGLGSVANAARRDQWSDHDFFWIVAGDAESYRQRFDWLPNADAIVFQVRETAHGLKVIYADGHLVEYAVFDRDELNLARVNDYAVLVDKADIGERLACLQQVSAPPAIDPARELGLVLGIVHVGISRCARGEWLSGHLYLKSHVLTHLMTLLNALFAPDHPLADNLDPFRRFERMQPEIGAELNRLLLLPPLDYAAGLLTLIDVWVLPRLPDFSPAAIPALRAHLQRARTMQS